MTNRGESGLRKARLTAGLSQRELARRSGVGQPRISEYENGHVRPQLAAIEALARGLGREPAEVAAYFIRHGS